MERVYWIYILASRPHGALYVGVTNDLGRRVYEHKAGVGSEHARHYRIRHLVYTESYRNVWDAIAREKQIKKWRRQWKIDLIKTTNPAWDDLYPTLLA